MNERHLSGQWAEFMAAAYYAKKGYAIVWPSAAQSRYDFIADRDGILTRVQVKKAYWNKSGNWEYLQARLGSDTRAGQFPNKADRYTSDCCEVIALVDDDCNIWLAPIEDVQGTTNLCIRSNCPKPSKTRKPYDPDKWYKGKVYEQD